MQTDDDHSDHDNSRQLYRPVNTTVPTAVSVEDRDNDNDNAGSHGNDSTSKKRQGNRAVGQTLTTGQLPKNVSRIYSLHK